ncbi:uncharacterized protein LOC118317845 isoform X2 [Scophthalmus maximus]|uniref:uncharacterized protein LOC118317845 isoform X2 n=1 Tax=Scophthalmus maximus TaxID=52904 RepID=UPI0015E144FC|nr:uncharacterized protein LOC118317845 isoform X2 [Scophthalmus maximus]
MFYTDCFSVAKAPTSYVQNKLSFETVCNSTMPVRRVLHMEKAQHNPASRLPVPARNQKAPTAPASSQAGRTKVTADEEEVPQTELEKLDSMRSKLEQSVDAFVRARKELEEILPAEGSSEQGRFLTGSSADLRTELKRHKELTSTEASSTKGNKDPNNHSGGPAKMGDSYKFLKSIMG